jgi:hypothetical protein
MGWAPISWQPNRWRLCMSGSLLTFELLLLFFFSIFFLLYQIPENAKKKKRIKYLRHPCSFKTLFFTPEFFIFFIGDIYMLWEKA